MCVGLQYGQIHETQEWWWFSVKIINEIFFGGKSLGNAHNAQTQKKI